MPFRWTEENKIHIALNEIIENGRKGVLRASGFLGFSVNAANSDHPISFHVENAYIRLVPQEQTDDQRQDYKNAYIKWIAFNSIRELVESFGLFMNDIYFAFLLTRHLNEKSLKELQEQLADFQQLGEKRRLKRLVEDFDLQIDTYSHLCSLIEARNTITHRWGIQKNKDLMVSWKKHELFVMDDDGGEIVLQLPIKDPVYIEKGGVAGCRVVDASRTFQHNEMLEFSADEIHEICLTFYFAIDQIVKPLGAFSKYDTENDHA